MPIIEDRSITLSEAVDLTVAKLIEKLKTFPQDMLVEAGYEGTSSYMSQFYVYRRDLEELPPVLIIGCD